MPRTHAVGQRSRGHVHLGKVLQETARLIAVCYSGCVACPCDNGRASAAARPLVWSVLNARARQLSGGRQLLRQARRCRARGGDATPGGTSCASCSAPPCCRRHTLLRIVSDALVRRSSRDRRWRARCRLVCRGVTCRPWGPRRTRSCSGPVRAASCPSASCPCRPSTTGTQWAPTPCHMRSSTPAGTAIPRALLSRV